MRVCWKCGGGHRISVNKQLKKKTEETVDLQRNVEKERNDRGEDQ